MRKEIIKYMLAKPKFLLIQIPLFEQLPYISENEATLINYRILIQHFDDQ